MSPPFARTRPIGRRSCSLHRADPAPAEDAVQDRAVSSPVEVAVRVEDGARAAREGGEAVELEVALHDDAGRHAPLGRLPDIPQGGRPDLAVVVLVGARAGVEALVGGGRAAPPDPGRGPFAEGPAPA